MSKSNLETIIKNLQAFENSSNWWERKRFYNQIKKECRAVDLKDTKDLNPDEKIFLIKFLYHITCNDLFLVSIKNITKEDKENFINMHEEILNTLKKFQLNLEKFQ